MADSSLAHGLHAYGAWRAALVERVDACRRWLSENNLRDAQTDLRLQQLLAHLADDRPVVAFVAGAGSGNSELISAIFFAEEASRYGMLEPDAGRSPAITVGDGAVEAPRWCHAVINVPHPMLAQGLVVLDTSGPEELAGEPGPALAALPDTDVVLLVLAADAGVTGRSLALLREWTNRASGRRCLAVLNNIDTLWNGPRSEVQSAGAIAALLDDCSRALGLEPSRLFAVSAKKGLVAKINGDSDLLARSGLPALEHALATELIQARNGTLGDCARTEIQSIADATRSRLDARRRRVLEQLQELEYLRGKNRGMIRLMMQKVGAEKGNLERELSSYQALRGVFAAHANRLFTRLVMDALSEDWHRAREEMRASVFSAGVRSAMIRFLRNARDGLERSSDQVAEISDLMAAMYRKFSDEHGLRLASPAPFSMLKYLKELDRLEAIYERRFNTLMAMLTYEKRSLMHKFFEILASRVLRCYEYANREAEQWLRAIMAPMQTQVDEHQVQFRRRLESIKRIHGAVETLGDRMEELLAIEGGIRAQIAALDQMSAAVEHAIESGRIPVARAA